MQHGEMSRDVGKDIMTGPETEELLSARSDTQHTDANPQPDERWFTETLSGVSSPRLTSQYSSTGLNHGVQVGATSTNSAAVVSSSSIVINSEDNDNPPPYSAIPPPYSAIAPPDHTVGWRCETFSFGDSTNRTTCRMEMPLTPFQDSIIPITGFHHDRINDRSAFQMPLTSYRFFKFGLDRSYFVPEERSFSDNEISEKIDDRKPRRYSAILVAAAVIIFLMVLSLIVRFVVEKSLLRR